MSDQRMKRSVDLLEPYRHCGRDIATVYLPTRSAVEDAQDRLDIRAKNVAAELDGRGASSELVDLVASALDGHDHADGEGLVLVATSEEILLEHPTIRPVARTVVHLGPTPLLLPLLAATRADRPHVAVLLDRTGADAWARTDLGSPIATETVIGDELHVHRGHPGGWSQRRFQQRAENTWESNAKQVIDEIVAVGDETPDVVVVGGDVRAVGFFRDHLPSGIDVLEVEASRAAAHEAFLDRVDDAVRSLAAADLVDEVEQLREAIAVGTGVAGPETLVLASQSRLDRLYVVDDSFDGGRPTSRFDFAIPLVVDDGYDRLDSVDDPIVAPRTDGAVCLALATGADVVVLPATGVAGVEGNIAGLRRS